ncbi:hypothetical protein [Flexivirga caeni]|uniref:Uncharacterized protein n=1 Tax=Flexivirga caeni TaxID=2294115 RepID=A0A3M9MIB6_9MICO|nr:hypothetical protein [Flexivirga caeni]RNI25244.1 hypothetical protein EFY87_00985 [Flexivirga caeni]
MTDQGEPDHERDVPPERRVVRIPVRRTPNFLRFIITGAVIGFIVGAIIASSGADADGYSARTGVALIGGILAAVGALLAAIVALLLERILNRQ